MADNVPITAGAGTSVSTEEITTLNGGAVAAQHVQRVLPSIRSADGTAIDVTTADPLPVRNPSVLSTVNSTTAVLGVGAAFTGTAEEVIDFSIVHINVHASHASATDGLSVQQSSDGTNWDHTDTFTVPAATGKAFSFQPIARYLRVVYTNGGTLQTTFRLQTVYHRMLTKMSSQRPSDGYSNENDFFQAWSMQSVWNGATWDRAPGNTAGAYVQGGVAHDAVESGNPVSTGCTAIAHSTAPSPVAAGDRVRNIANRHGVPFVIGGHPNILNFRLRFTAAQTNVALVTAAAGFKIILTRLTVTLDNASTVFPSVLIGMGATTTPTTTAILDHPGVPAGGGVNLGDGSGIIGDGAADEDLRVTTVGVATGNGVAITGSYYLLEA